MTKKNLCQRVILFFNFFKNFFIQKNKRTIYRKISKILKFLSSLKLAVINLVLLAILSSIGTFLESYYDLEFAQVYLYRSIWMKLALISLSINVAAVLVDRWPWKKRHISFVTAHFGILMLVIGSWITQVKGVDGSMRLVPHQDTRYIILSSKILTVHSSFNGDNLTELYRSEPRFLTQKPSLKKPYVIPLGSDQMRVIGYYPYALQSIDFEPNLNSGMLFQFQLKGTQSSVFDWLYLKKGRDHTKKKIGLATIGIHNKLQSFQEQNELILKPKDSQTVLYLLKSKGQFKKAGEIKKNQSIQTGWMDLKFRLIDFYRADQVYRFTQKKQPNDQTNSAIQVEFQGQTRWLPLNSFTSFYMKDRVYIVGYRNQRLNIGTNIRLEKFHITKYPNSTKAKEYKSLVQVDHHQKVTISMNEPLKHKGWTFYQSGFEEKDQKIEASILAVNRDSGRWIKYIGSFLIVIGIFALFYTKRRKKKKA